MKFTKDHEWVKIENGVATIGITEYAADALGELVYVELPKVGNSYNKGDAFAVVESSKSASDVYIPASGSVISVNQDLTASPELINNANYVNGWIAKVKLSDESELADAMDENAYKKYLEEK